MLIAIVIWFVADASSLESACGRADGQRVSYDGPGYEDPRDWNSDSLHSQRLSDALTQLGPKAAEALVAATEQYRGWGILVLERVVAHTGEAWPTELLVRALAVGAVKEPGRLLQGDKTRLSSRGGVNPFVSSVVDP